MGWQLEKKITIGAVVQVILLAFLIIGSWVNTQMRLNSLQKDVDSLIRSNVKADSDRETIFQRVVDHEYRIRSVEKLRSGNPKATQDPNG